ncbi:MAG: flagellar hook assembly protein FlgD [Spirochaetaceae bacterium]|nr:flagellar hook assembly protein FlgD [Spirochaetaceae bacterium]
MDISSTMTDIEKSRIQMQVDSFNKTLAASQQRASKNQLDKDDFLKILITQLTHQDPTKPMEDREFIAQMAQFSSLEQMTNMSKEFAKMQNVIASNQAISLIGKTVQVTDGEQVITGKVEEVSGYEYPQLLVNGKYYDMSRIEKIRQE